jgi:hypothetical protein
MRTTKVKEPTQWKFIPEHYRHCLASGKHSLALTQNGSLRGTVIEWYACLLCNSQRLTTRTPIGEVEHIYSRPADYHLPIGFTVEDKREWLFYESKLNLIDSSVDKIDLQAVKDTFGYEFK